MTTTIRLAHSPDSDDAFMFYGLSSGAVRVDGVEFAHELHDIETLNRAAVEQVFEVTALSVHAYAYLAPKYLLLDSGASFGDGYGPILVSRAGSPFSTPESLAGRRIAIPGKWTSAALALSLRLPEHQAILCDFKAVGDWVRAGEVDAGVLIHEGQLTVAEEGLHSVEDLGRWWKGRTGLPLPLGMNAIKRSLPEPLRQTIARALADSIEYSLAHREEALDHAMRYARGLDRGRADRFVGMYVNDWTRRLGDRGREAVARFLGESAQLGLIPHVSPEYQER